MIPKINKLTYPERLRHLKLPTLAYRRARGDMIEVFKIISKIYHKKSTEHLLNLREQNNISLRGHIFTLEHKRLYTSARINYFVNRVVINWNSLPSSLVGAGSLNIFKNSLDRLWSKQELLYQYRASINKKDYVY